MTKQSQAKKFCGFLNVLKPPGMSSAQVVGMVRRFLGGEKVGHAGTLDPEAAGVLPLMVGKAARLFDYLQEKEKAYVAEVAFGCSTDTQDAQGQPLERSDAYPDEQALRKALVGFTGEQMQQPPMYSAIKQDGKRMYELAREGKTVELPARQVRVHALALERMLPGHGALLAVRCSKGFYVRTLCQDLGKALGCPAHMRFLLRTQTGVFTLETARTLEELAEAAEKGNMESCLLPVETALSHLPCTQVPQGLRKAFLTGGTLPWKDFPVLQGTEAEKGAMARFCMDGCTAALGRRQGEYMKLEVWLAD